MDADNILSWPTFAADDLDLVIIGFVTVFLIFVVFQFLFFYRTARKAHVNSFLARAMKMGLTGQEISLIKKFIENAERKMKSHDFEKENFRSALLEYLKNRKIDARTGVRIIEKLYPEPGYSGQVHTYQDLYEGEPVSLEVSGEQLLGKIVRIQEETISVLIPAIMKKISTPAKTSVYVYRPPIGGYLFQGRMIRVQKELVTVQIEGEATAMGDVHLMAMLDLPVIIRAWEGFAAAKSGTPDTVEPAEQSGEPGPARGKSENDAIEEENTPVEFQGKTEKVSDRGFIFHVPDHMEHYLKHSTIWETELTLPGGFYLNCKGNIIPVPGHPLRYIFRYTDVSEETRAELFNIIKKYGAMREQLQ